MSGGALAFQKLNGAGTQMQNLIDSVNKSDLYKMAKEFAPNVNLTPICKSWEIGINENAVNDLTLGGLYFGRWILNHNSQDVGNNDNSRKRSQAFLKYGNDVVARTMVIVHGDDILAWGTQTTEHYGFATSLHVHKLEVDDQPQHGVQVSFIGYKISNDAGFVFPAPVVIPNQNATGNTALSAQDLTSAGYTYHWSEVTNSGSFTSPNSPNTVFIPDGNGNYTLHLVVTDSEGVVSAPVVVPVVIDNIATIEVQNLSYPQQFNVYVSGVYAQQHLNFGVNELRHYVVPSTTPNPHEAFIEVENAPWWHFSTRKVFVDEVEDVSRRLDQYPQIPQTALNLDGSDLFRLEFDTYTRPQDLGKFITVDGYPHENAVIMNMVFDGADKHYQEVSIGYPYGYLVGAQSCYIGHGYCSFSVYDHDNILVGVSSWVSEQNRHVYTLLNLVSDSYKVTLNNP